MMNLKKVTKGIYHLSFDDHILLTHHFMRFQEIYESPSDKFKNKPFQLIDYIEYYTRTCSSSKREECKSFNYNSDWAGFNLPVRIINDFYDLLTDANDNDKLMKQIARLIIKDHGSSFCYLIGSKGEDLSTLKHEIAHGLYYTNIKYKKEIDNIINDFNEKHPEKYDLFKKVLLHMGYCDDVIDDEIQAYSSTGVPEEIKEKSILPLSVKRKFSKTFNLYYKKCNTK